MIKESIAILILAGATYTSAADKITLVLDWHINPNHAPIMVAQEIGAFRAANLDVTLIPPSDPSVPPRLVAAKQADLDITYQPQLHFFADQGLPLVRVGTLIDHPLNTLITLDKNIHSLVELKGKKIGFSVSGMEEATLDTMLRHDHLTLQDIQMVNVNFQLTSALMAGQVDAVIGCYRNIEVLALQQMGKQPVVFNVQDYGIPPYDELIIVANKTALAEPKIKRFLGALKQGTDYLISHPDESWRAFARAYPDLNTALNRLAWEATLPLFAKDPAHLDIQRYQEYQQFLVDKHLIIHQRPISAYAVELR